MPNGVIGAVALSFFAGVCDGSMGVWASAAGAIDHDHTTELAVASTTARTRSDVRPRFIARHRSTRRSPNRPGSRRWDSNP